MKTSAFVFVLVVIILCFSFASSDMKIGMEDYNFQIDPTPTTRESLKPGPTEHGTPTNPFIPTKPPPPPPSSYSSYSPPPSSSSSSYSPPPQSQVDGG